MNTSPLGRTALFDLHLEAGGRIVPFAGWEMPVQYAGVRAESLAVRDECGLFDVGHMGQLDVSGPEATQALNRIVSADWSKVPVGRAAYALLLNENAGVHDDIMGYRLAPERWLVVVNASRAHEDEAFLRRHLPPEIALSNRYGDQAMVAIQGPRAQELLQPLCDTDLSTLAFRDVREVQVLGRRAILARGGYTGCDGFEWMGDATTAQPLWRGLLGRGAVPCGLGARDVLRLEAGLPLYGHELNEERTPDESGVAFAVKTEKGPFVGREALLSHRAAGEAPRALRGLRMTGRAIPREGYSVRSNEQEIGVVTSGTLSPSLNAGIALALLPRELEPGDCVNVIIRNTAHAAQVVALPFVPRSTKPVVLSEMKKETAL
jgi:aminomethyltransferase